VMMSTGVSNYHSFITAGAIQPCPACPQPGVNIPMNWSEQDYRSVRSEIHAFSEAQFHRDLLFAVFLSGDGNFHMQLMSRSKPLFQDPSYFGDAGVFAEYSRYHNYWNEVNKSCTTAKVKQIV
jgi:hypothetical protein